MLALLLAVASAAPLTVDPARVPQVVSARPELGPGAVRLRFEHPREVQVDALPAVVVSLGPGAPVPSELARTGHPLGPGDRSWRVPTGDVVEEAARWAAHPSVSSALPDLVIPRRAHHVPNDPGYGAQWYHELLGTELLWDVTTGDPAVRVAVIDSGIALDHPDLQGAFVDPYDAYADDDDPSPDPGAFCPQGDGICDDHGTGVAGIVGARIDDGIGIAGFCPSCSLVPIKLLGDGRGALSADVAAFEHVIASGAAVVNNSWGFAESMPVPGPLADVVRRAATEGRDGLGTLVVFAAGNDDRVIADDELAAMPEVLCVGATDRYGVPTAYTNSGAALDVAAPSATYTTAADGGYLETFGGTSAAAPVVSGLAGWMVSVDPSLTADELRDLFIDTAYRSTRVTFDEDGHHDVYGYGEIDALALRDAVAPETRGACGCASGGGSGAFALPLLLVLLRRRTR